MTTYPPTPRPWLVVSGAIFQDTLGDTRGARPIATMVRNEYADRAGIPPVERDANARLIVRAVNNYDELVTALRDLLNDTEPDRIERAYRALYHTREE